MPQGHALRNCSHSCVVEATTPLNIFVFFFAWSWSLVYGQHSLLSLLPHGMTHGMAAQDEDVGE